MSVIRAIRDSLKATRPQYPNWALANAAAEQFAMPPRTLPEAQAELYQRLAAVSTAVDMVANLGTTAKLNVKRVSGEKMVDIPNHPFEMLLNKPNPLDSRSELLFGTLAYRALTGNAYWFLNRMSETEPPAELWLIPSHQIVPVPDGRSYLDGYDYDPGSGETMRLATWQICHFKRFNPMNRFIGLSLVEALATDATAEMAMQRYNANYFGKDNAKVPGALAFADPINDSDWKRLQDEARKNWGGTNRSGPMMLRSVGAGGVQWVAMALTQEEMQFLAGRQFIKEEIWSGFAPGLSSMLAINANEANSRTGKAILIEMGVWPMLTAIAEKVTANILPAYGAEYIADFDDIRITDKAMELQEQQAYAQVHTVDEIRQEYYEDGPLSDERGQLLPAQIGPNTPLPGSEELGPQEPEQPNEAPGQQEENSQEAERGQVQEETETETEGQVKAELARWLRKAQRAVKAGKAASVGFESDVIPLALHGAISGALEAAKTADDVRGVFSDVWMGYP